MAKRIGKYKITKRDSAISLVDGGTVSNNFVSSEKGENFVQSLSEGSITGGSGGVPADDGPSYAYGNFNSKYA